MRHLTEDPPVEHLPPRFRDVVEKALHKDPALRYASIEEMAAALPLNPLVKQVVNTPVVTATVIDHPQPEKELLYIGEEPRVPEMQFGPVRQHPTATVTNIPPVRSKVSYVRQTATTTANNTHACLHVILRPPRAASGGGSANG